MKYGMLLKTATVALTLTAGLMGTNLTQAADEKAAGKTETIKGEVVDLMCYLDHGAKGEAHKACAETCIKSGGPVGLLSGDQVYLIIGEHKPINDQLAAKAAQTVTVTGKVVERNGMKMIENAVLEK